MNTRHVFVRGDARDMSAIGDTSVHLAVTSPPYWTLKEYPPNEAQLGHMEDYEQFLEALDVVWRECLRALVPGGRLCVNVGDVCLSRRKHGRHRVVPLHADISTRCTRMGFDYLTPILWYKITNINLEASRSSRYLGKPNEPNGVIKNDIEYILLLRKPGGYRKPTEAMRTESMIDKDDYARWFSPIWTDLRGASTNHHPAPFPEELPYRLIRMFSFAGDTVLDPFLGRGTTSAAATSAERNSIGYEVDNEYLLGAHARWREKYGELFGEETCEVYDVSGHAAPKPPQPLVCAKAASAVEA